MRRSKTIDWEDDFQRRNADGFRCVCLFRFIGYSLITLIVLIGLYYGVGSFIVHNIDDDLTFRPTEVPAGGSQAVAMAAALIERETVTHDWTPNNPWFFPSYPLDNMPNFQQGIIGALWRFGIEMSDQIGQNARVLRGRSGP